jgi:hypothetical protein
VIGTNDRITRFCTSVDRQIQPLRGSLSMRTPEQMTVEGGEFGRSTCRLVQVIGHSLLTSAASYTGGAVRENRSDSYLVAVAPAIASAAISWGLLVLATRGFSQVHLGACCALQGGVVSGSYMVTLRTKEEVPGLARLGRHLPAHHVMHVLPLRSAHRDAGGAM